MHLDKFVISVIIFLVIIVAGAMIVTDVNTNYDDVDMDIDQYLGNTSETAEGSASYNYSREMQGHLINDEVDADTADSMFGGAFSAVRIITTPVSLVNDVLTQVTSEIGIPQIFVRYAFTAIAVLVIFAIIFIIFRIKA